MKRNAGPSARALKEDKKAAPTLRSGPAVHAPPSGQSGSGKVANQEAQEDGRRKKKKKKNIKNAA